MQIHCSTRSVILNVTVTQNTRSLNSIYTPTDQYSEVVIVHTCAFQSNLLGCQVTLMLCILIILTMAAVFPDRSHMCDQLDPWPLSLSRKSPL